MLHLSDEVRAALESGQAVVALESTVIAHGLPYPINLETARRMEEIIRQSDAVPATIALLEGVIRVGLTGAELEHLATSKAIRKTSRRDLPIVVAQQGDGATTVAATATVAAWAGIEVFATGGIGGVHREPPYDISNDLPTLASTPVAVVCSGAKAILDLRATVEWLETAGVPVIGYDTDELPAFYTRQSGLPVDVRVESAQQAASIIRAGREMGMPGGTLVVVPVPAVDEMEPQRLTRAIESALSEASARGIEGSGSTPFLLRWVARETGGASLKANVSLLESNAGVAAQIAVALQGTPGTRSTIPD
jgi:pseudouridine-5'-phosphate glycosidase